MKEDTMKKIKLLSITSLIISLVLFTASTTAFQKRQRKPIFDFQQNPPLIQNINQNPSSLPPTDAYSSDHILVKFKPLIPDEYVKATINSFQISEYQVIPRINVFKIQVPENSSVEDMLYLMKQHQYVLYAEPDYFIYIHVTPNDLLFNYQYALYNSGQYIGDPPGSPQGQPSADIKATLGWEETKGTEDTIIAIVDTGIDLYHPELENKLESSGRDFVNGDFEALDDEGHGTMVAGIVAAETNNNEGIAGVSWNSKLLPVKVIDETGVGESSIVSEGIIWAVDQGAVVANLSFGSPFASYALQDAIQYAHQNDVVVVASAGNDGDSVDFPAANDEYCLAVAATDYNDQRVDWSDFGPEIDVAAPGVRILSTYPTQLTPQIYLPYAWGYGTSFSAPHVSGLAALILSIKPWMTADEVMDVIRYSADDINEDSNPGKDTFIGYGRINMEKALVPIVIEQQEINKN
jgi:subtilisin family serine protease